MPSYAFKQKSVNVDMQLNSILTAYATKFEMNPDRSIKSHLILTIIFF